MMCVLSSLGHFLSKIAVSFGVDLQLNSIDTNLRVSGYKFYSDCSLIQRFLFSLCCFYFYRNPNFK